MKKKNTKKLNFLTDLGMSQFLEFLRNLAPQVFLLAVSFLFFERLDFSKFDLNNITPTVTPFVLLGVSFYAFFSNIFLFLKQWFSGLLAWHKRLQSLIRRKKFTKPSSHYKFFAFAIWDRKLLNHIEFSITLAILILVIFTTYVLMSMVTATTFWNAIHVTKVSCPKGFICTPLI